MCSSASKVDVKPSRVHSCCTRSAAVTVLREKGNIDSTGGWLGTDVVKEVAKERGCT